MSVRRPGTCPWFTPLMTAAFTMAMGTPLPCWSQQLEIDAYVQAPDPSFAWRLQANDQTPAGRVIAIDLTSQTWQGIPWTHQLRVYVPSQLTFPDACLLFITGGSTDSKPRPEDALFGFALAEACVARVAVLPQVPNQPLLDGKKEDDLISETFVRYLNTGDPTLPLLFPMTKSAIRAMDAVQEWAENDGQPVARFVVTGASKRGWTTWLTGALDRRVVAIAPMVIPTLNMRAQTKHQLDVWGFYSEQIADYTRRGLTEKFDDPAGRKLWMMVDPYSYRDRLTLPKLQINGTNDRYWTLDSLNLYWDDLKGPSYVVYLPNAGHNLAVNREYAVQGIAALFRHTVTGRAMPRLRWRHADDDQGQPLLTIESTPPPKEVRLWTTTAKDLDFRESQWVTAGPQPGKPSQTFQAIKPQTGAFALFGDLTYEIDGREYHLSTQIRQIGTKAKAE